MDYQTFNLLFKCSKEFSHGKIRMQDLTDTECMICSYVCAHEGCSQEAVSIALKTDKTTVGKALAMLEKKGCVAREQDPADRRIKRLSLTDSGRERIAEIVDLHNRWLAEVLACLSEEEQKHFEAACERLLDAAEKIAQNNGGIRS